VNALSLAFGPPPMAVQGAQCYRLPMQAAARSLASVAMDRYAEGDARAFGELYDALAPRLAAYLRRRLRSSSAVDDALQHTFMQLHVHRGKFERGARVEPWAYAIARAASIDIARREAVRRGDALDAERIAGEGESGEEAVRAGELSAAFADELAALSPKLREAFLLVRVDGLSHAEAAAVLGIEESATKVRAHRAGQWLREKLARFAGAEK